MLWTGMYVRDMTAPVSYYSKVDLVRCRALCVVCFPVVICSVRVHTTRFCPL